MPGTVLSADNTLVSETDQCSYFQGAYNVVRGRNGINIYGNRTRGKWNFTLN